MSGKMKIGERIRYEREQKGWSIEKLSQEVGWSKAHITRIELGQRKCISLNYLFGFSKALNIPFNELIKLALEDFYGQDFSEMQLLNPSICNENLGTIEEIIRMLAALDGEDIKYIHRVTEAFLVQKIAQDPKK